MILHVDSGNSVSVLKWRWAVLSVALCSLLSIAPADGQRPLQFDAATIKLDQIGSGRGGRRGGPGTSDPGRITWEKVWLRDLVATAFHVDPGNVSGPAWISRDGAQLYALRATMPPETTRQDFERMLQNFLIQELKIQLHHQPKPFPAYDLIVAPNGPRLRLSDDQSSPDAPDGPMFVPKIDSQGFPVLPPGHRALGAMGGGFHGTFQRYTMSELAEYLSGYVTPEGEVTHYIVDKTGLTGRYDFKIKFDASDQTIRLGPEAQAQLPPPSTADNGLPTVFKALDQQLGLRLVKAKDILLDTIVIDHAERIPVAN